MKAILRSLVLLLSLCLPASAFMLLLVSSTGTIIGYGGGPNLRAQNIFGAPISVTPDQYYVPGTGSPAVSTADYYWVNGSIQQRPYDLSKSECGAAGAAKVAAGQRYAWPMTPNHEGLGNTGDVDGVDIYLGYSNDPGIMPQSASPIYRAQNAILPLAPAATVTGSISSNTLNVSAVGSGLVSLRAAVSGSGVTAGAKTSASNSGSGTGGTGTYTLSPGSSNVGSESITLQQVNSVVAYFSYFVCNPDDPTYPFYLYIQAGPGDAGYQEGLLKSTDMSDWVYQETPFRNYDNNGIVRDMQVSRTGTNTWIAFGPTLQPDSATSNQFGNGLWTSTDGRFFTYGGALSNQCIPVQPTGIGGFGPHYCSDGSSNFDGSGAMADGLSFTVGAQAYMAFREDANTVNNSNLGQFVARVPVDGSFNVLASPSYVRISNEYFGFYPGPTYVISVGSYVEDGIAHYYATHGNYECLAAAGCDITQSKYGSQAITTASTSASGSSVLHMTSTSGLFSNMNVTSRTNSSVAFPSKISSIAGNDVTLDTPLAGNVGAGDSILFYSSGLRQEFVDHYSEIIDATAAASAAPIGVTISVSGGIVSLNWYDALPNNTYRVYRGASLTSQPTLVGDVTGASMSDTPYLQTPTILYYKVVTLHNGVEHGSRVVWSYVSSSASFVNQHITRALLAGADPATINRARLDAVDAWLTAHNRKKNLQTWMSPSFGVIQDSNGKVSTAFDLGTTRLPRAGDFQPTNVSTHVTTYDPIGLNGTVPGLVNTDSQSFGAFGNGRVNNIRRKVEVTACASYSKPGTGVATLLNFGTYNEIAIGMTLQHTSGTPGNASFSLGDDSSQQTVTSAMSSATGPHFICGTFDTAGATTPTSTGTLKAYADGVAGSANNSLHSNIDMSLSTTLSGQAVNFGISNTIPVLGTGSSHIKAAAPSVNAGPANPYTYTFEDNEGNFTSGDVIMFDVALTQAEITSLTALVSDYVSPPVAQSYLITNAPFNATCNGSADDSSAFAAWNTTAVAWDAANPGVAGDIVLNIPNSKCMFLQMSSGIYITKGIIKHRVRIVGAGSSSEFSEGGTGGGWFLGASGEDFGGTNQTLTHTALKGATSVTLSACPGAGCSAALALFTVGQWGRMSGIAMQGNGNPTNPAFWDYVLVSGKTATDVQFATTPLTHDYKSTWPAYGSAYYGGPATLYAMDASWPITMEVNNLILSITNPAAGGIAIVGKDITLKKVTINTNVDGSSCEVPSQNMAYRIIVATMTSCIIEVDKIIDYLLYQNVSIQSIHFQSASVKQAVFDTVIVSSNVNGSGINTTIYNSNIASWSPGTTSFGASYGQTIVLNSTLSSVGSFSASSSDADTVGSWSGGIYTIANSDIPTVSGSNAALPWAIPGANIFWGGRYPTQGPVMQVTDLTQDATNTYVHTTLAGGLPTMPVGLGVSPKAHPAPQFTCSGCSGSADAIDLNQGTAGAPMWSYSKRTITSANGNPASAITLPVWGQMVGVNITVTTAYAGSTGTMHFDLNGPFFQQLGSTSSSLQWNTFEINAKVASTTPRFLGPTSTSGSQSGDTLTSPSGGANSWFVNNQLQPVYSSIPGDFGSTSTTIEIKTNQGVVNLNYLLKRDLVPAANDNSPVGLDQAA